MSNIKRFIEKISIEMGMKGEICSAVEKKAQAILLSKKQVKK